MTVTISVVQEIFTSVPNAPLLATVKHQASNTLNSLPIEFRGVRLGHHLPLKFCHVHVGQMVRVTIRLRSDELVQGIYPWEDFEKGRQFTRSAVEETLPGAMMCSVQVFKP